jgi:hypothetical protein
MPLGSVGSDCFVAWNVWVGVSARQVDKVGVIFCLCLAEYTLHIFWQT